jgi:hypothetical protein
MKIAVSEAKPQIGSMKRRCKFRRDSGKLAEYSRRARRTYNKSVNGRNSRPAKKPITLVISLFHDFGTARQRSLERKRDIHRPR